jgi:hypothetical protein
MKKNNDNAKPLSDSGPYNEHLGALVDACSLLSAIEAPGRGHYCELLSRIGMRGVDFVDETILAVAEICNECDLLERQKTSFTFGLAESSNPLLREDLADVSLIRPYSAWTRAFALQELLFVKSGLVSVSSGDIPSDVLQ